jgi:hypothetical protein
MPMSDSSQFTEYRRRLAIQNGDTQQQDPKSITKFSTFSPRVSVLDLTKFLGNPTYKFVETPSGGGGGPIILTLDVDSIDFSTSDTYSITPTISGASSSNVIQLQFSGSNATLDFIIKITINTTSYLFSNGITISTNGGEVVTGQGDNKTNLQLNMSTPIIISTVITITLPTSITDSSQLDNPVVITS